LAKTPIDKKLLPEQSEPNILAVCTILIALIFVLDVSLRIGFVVSILYVVPVLVCIWSPERRTIFIVAGVASVLTLIAIPIKPPGDFLIPLFNRPVSLISIWTVAGLVDRFNNVRKQADDERNTTIEFLRLVNESRQTEDLIHSATSFFQKQSGCEAVGIRLRKGDDYPYYETKGFPQEFVLLETNLCDYDEKGKPCKDSCGDPILECMCGNVIQGRTDPEKPFFTAKGSFWTNSTTELLANSTDADRQARTRNRCNGEGYESVALIALRIGGETFGLLQMNDRRKGMYSIDMIERWERLAGYLAVALAKFRTEMDLKESEARYRGLFENIQEVVAVRRLVYDDKGEIVDMELVDANPATLTAYGVNSIDEVRGKRNSELNAPELMASGIQNMKRLHSSGQPITEETHFESNNKDYLTTSVLLGEDIVLSAGVDITDIKRAQRNADEYSKKLEISNKELQQFAYVASHDLQEPLRMVTAYLSLLEKRYSDRLDGKAKQYMDLAIDGGLRAKDLIHDLLEFSRIDPQVKEFQDVSMEEVLVKTLDNLSVSIKEEKAVISHGPLPTILADSLQMIQVLQNLIGNAIKFRGADPPIIHILCDDDGNEWRFSVSDNGIGIDPQYQDKIFVLFQRLHSKEEYEGTGIGLAVCKKIVERHGGRIWFDSRPGSGTTFYFTIPKRSRKWSGNS
jgi:signal transduction histidine kinase